MIRTIRIAAALIEDGGGRVLLVRKAGTRHFMQAGGKIEAGETPLAALRRELREEIGLDVTDERPVHIGRFSAMAANEPDHRVTAELFRIRTAHDPIVAAEIAEAVWVTIAEAMALPLAPLTREHVLPLASGYSSAARIGLRS